MPFALTNKLFSLYVRLRYPQVPPELRYFYRDTYNCEMAQLKYVVQDYITKSHTRIFISTASLRPSWSLCCLLLTGIIKMAP
jgi:hypothetical protein